MWQYSLQIDLQLSFRAFAVVLESESVNYFGIWISKERIWRYCHWFHQILLQLNSLHLCTNILELPRTMWDYRSQFQWYIVWMWNKIRSDAVTYRRVKALAHWLIHLITDSPNSTLPLVGFILDLTLTLTCCEFPVGYVLYRSS